MNIVYEYGTVCIYTRGEITTGTVRRMARPRASRALISGSSMSRRVTCVAIIVFYDHSVKTHTLWTHLRATREIAIGQKRYDHHRRRRPHSGARRGGRCEPTATM